MRDARRRARERFLVGTLIATLLVVAPGAVGPADGTDHHKPWGRLRAPDQTLEKGCNKYFFRYRVNPPRDEWLAEMFVVSPDGDNIHHAVQDSEFHSNRGKIRFTICKPSTDFGRHKLRMRVHWYENDLEHTEHVGWVKPNYFRMTRP